MALGGFVDRLHEPRKELVRIAGAAFLKRAVLTHGDFDCAPPSVVSQGMSL